MLVWGVDQVNLFPLLIHQLWLGQIRTSRYKPQGSSRTSSGSVFGPEHGTRAPVVPPSPQVRYDWSPRKIVNLSWNPEPLLEPRSLLSRAPSGFAPDTRSTRSASAARALAAVRLSSTAETPSGWVGDWSTAALVEEVEVVGASEVGTEWM